MALAALAVALLAEAMLTLAVVTVTVLALHAAVAVLLAWRQTGSKEVGQQALDSASQGAQI